MMRKFTIFFLAIFLGLIVSTDRFSTTGTVFAQGLPIQLDETTSAQLQAAYKVRDLLFKRRYAAVEKKLAEIRKKWPDDIMGYVGMMLLYQIRNFENFDHRYDKEYLKWHDQGRDRALAILKMKNPNPWHLFLAGSTLTLTGLYQFRADHRVRALLDGVRGIDAWKDCIKIDPDWVDPLQGLGTYKYCRTVFTERLRFLPFFPDSREEGIRLLTTAMNRGFFTPDLAQASLAWIYFNEKDYQQALKLNAILYKRYPQNVMIRILQGQLLTKLKKYRQALSVYQSILKTDPDLSNIYFYQAITMVDQIRHRFRPNAQEDDEKKQKKKAPIKVSAQEAKAYNPVISLLEKYIMMNPPKRSRASAYDMWAAILYLQEDMDGSRVKSKQALKLDYSLYPAKERLRQISNRK